LGCEIGGARVTQVVKAKVINSRPRQCGIPMCVETDVGLVDPRWGAEDETACAAIRNLQRSEGFERFSDERQPARVTVLSALDDRLRRGGIEGDVSPPQPDQLPTSRAG